MAELRVMVVEDEQHTRDGILRLLEKDPEVEVVGVAADGVTAIKLIRELKPDLLLLDVHIPEVDGFGVLQALPTAILPAVIFVSSHDQYTLQAFEVHALDYLLKPFDAARFRAALQHAKKQLNSDRGPQRTRIRELIRERTNEGSIRRVAVKSGGRIILLDLDNVIYVEAAGNYLKIHTAQKEYLSREKISDFELQLAGTDFVRIHRSAIVNRRYIKELRPWSTGEYVVFLQNGKELTLSRGFRDSLSDLIAAH